MASKPRKVTQREIAEIAGVSQSTVSMVLNDRDGASVRIPEATRARVRQAIEQSTYVADPAARRLAGLDNQIIGVFTYEAALSPESMDFYGPLLNGIERAAERAGCDLLFFTSSPVEDGSRRLFHKNTACGWPTAASCWDSGWTATTWPASSMSSSPSSRSVGATRQRPRCPTSDSTTSPRPPR